MKKTAVFLSAMILAVVAVYLLFPSGPPVRNQRPSGENIICFGDSLTYGTGSSPGMDYPSQLSGLVGLPVINAGVPGDTTKDALERLDKDVLARSPKIVIITLGGNDLKNKVLKEEAFGNLREIVERVQDQGALVVVGGIDIPLFGNGFGKGYKELCEDTGTLLVPNVYEGLLGREDLMSDPIHPNDRGYQIMAERFYAIIKDFL